MQLLDTVLDIAANKLPQAGIDCILVGGFAVDFHGYSRNTLDIDFMIFTEQLSEVRSIMTEAGFTNIVIEDIVAFFENPDSPLRVDFLRVDKNTLDNICNNAVRAEIHGYKLKVPALIDLIAMKIFSLSGNFTRRMAKDLPDITYLSIINNLDLKNDIQPLCSKYGTPELYDIISRQVKELQS